MNFRTIADLNNCIMRNLIKIPDVDIIIGVPRSGLLPATLLSLYLNKPMATLQEFNKGQIHLGGPRGKIKSGKIKKAIVIDDSVLMGTAINEAKSLLQHHRKVKFYFGAVYAAPKAVKKVDFFLEVCPMPRVFEWNVMHHSIMQKCCVDIDGILCPDPVYEQNDDGEEYIKFLLDAPILFKPTYPIKCLVSNRLEKYREHTMNWMQKHNIQYNSLYLANYPNQAARKQAQKYGEFKADIYLKEEDTVLFIESNIDQAIEIFEITKKPVYCLPEHRFFS